MLNAQHAFLTTSIVITLILSTLFVFNYLSPDQSYATADQQATLKDSIFSTHRVQYESIKKDCSNDKETKPFFNKLVFIVIDAFRSDFVKSTAKDEIEKKHNFSMPFVEKLLDQRRGLSAISRAQTPTVTLPKLKTLLSGSTSNFIDILFNLNAAEFGTDNLINQALTKKKRIVFYGDDTWLQMFNRSSFVRSNETLSFFARDYTTVDTNVTENMIPEMNKTDEWDILILHYLGVDHIGHNYGGINSKLLPAKLIEMDDVVKVIYESLSKLNENYLIFLTGDHGMTDLGNHGGNTEEETNTAVLLFTTDDKYQVKDRRADDLPIKVEQNDFASLLSFYLGLQIPNRSKGKIDLKLVNSFGDLKDANFHKTKLCYLFNNALQLQKMEGSASVRFINYFFLAVENHYKLISSDYKDHKRIREAEQNYDHYLNISQRSLIDIKNDNQNLNTLIIAILGQLVVLSIMIAYQINSKSFLFKELFFSRNTISLIAISTILVNVFSLGSTSFIEMEHHYFNYIASSLIFLHGFIVFRDRDLNVKELSSYFLVLLCLSISSNWTSLINFTLSTFKTESSQKMILFTVVAISLLVTRHYLIFGLDSTIKKLFFTTILVQIFIFKFDSYHDSKLIPSIKDYLKAQLVYLLLSIYLLLNLVHNFLRKNKLKFNLVDNQQDVSSDQYSTSTTFWIFLMSLLTKPDYLPLIPIQLFLENRIHQICSNESRRKVSNSFVFRKVIYIYLGMCSFVDLGNTNSLSTLDVSAGFTGLNEYNLVLVSIQMICSIFSTLVFWLIRSFERFNAMQLTAKNKSQILIFTFTIRLTFLVYFQMVAYLLINHLFIWSVITPKLLYEFALTELFELILIYVVLKTFLQ